MQRNKTVDEYIDAAPQWRDELRELRAILNSCDLEETVKWGGPCYTCDGKNVVGIGGFKSYFGLWFYQGALLDDSDGVLVNAQEGVTRALRQWRMTSAADIRPSAIRRYVREAIRLVRDGRQIAPRRKKSVVLPPEFERALQERSRAGTAFAALTQGRQREYAEYVASAKRDATRAARIEKILPMIEGGVGLNDRYRR